MSEHLSTERMHELLDGPVEKRDAAVARAHLGTCAPCRAEYEALARVLAELRGLPVEARAPEGLWPEIESRLGAAGAAFPAREGGDVLSLSAASDGRGARRRLRLSLSVPQLAAAAVLVAFLSAGSMWMALGRGPAGEAPVAATPTPEEALGPAARMAASGDVAYEAAVLQLEDLVEANRDVMAPETRDALDRSLRAIDEALAGIRDALAKDPNSELLARLLVNQQRSKLRVLRHAATAVRARS